MKLRVTVACVLFLVGCSDAGQGPSTSGAGDSDAALIASIEGVCAARDEAVRDPEAAAARFSNEAHDGIHRLAADVAPKDRDLAAGILEAKQAVEAAADASSASRLERALDRLAEAGASALVALDADPPACAGGGD